VKHVAWETKKMASYAARVSIPHPLIHPDDDGIPTICGYDVREVMFDNISASGQAKAKRRAKEEAKRYIKYLWADFAAVNQMNESDPSFPDSYLIDVARIKPDGSPVRKDFPTPEDFTPRVGVSDDPKVKQTRKRNTTTAKAIVKAIEAVKKPKVFNLVDPLTEDVLNRAMMKGEDL
jgi:hypothetical protein